jgi:flagellar basal body rod protein FlgG
MVAARTRLEIATENLANVSTNGFRRITARGLLSAFGVKIERDRAPELTRRPSAGGVDFSNRVDAIGEMIDVLAAERSFESAQKAVTAIDAVRQQSSQAARIS